MIQDVKEILKVESIDEVNTYLKNGWVLLETSSFVVDGVPQFFFLVGKTGLIRLKELRDEVAAEERNETVSAINE